MVCSRHSHARLGTVAQSPAEAPVVPSRSYLRMFSASRVIVQNTLDNS